ncbi:MAG: lnt [Frondihabitans sp.]|nr:lnt [Frondihabitans sp.]
MPSVAESSPTAVSEAPRSGSGSRQGWSTYNSRVPRFPQPLPSTAPNRLADFRLPLWGSLIVMIGAGALLAFSFPGDDIWGLSFPGIGLALVALMGRSAWGAFLVGLIGGLTFYLVLVEWVSRYLGAVPWFALAGLEAVYFALGAVAVTLAYRWLPRVWPGAVGRLVLLPTVIGALWVAREYAAGHWPYGGFSWGRVAESQSQSPLAPLVAWFGISGLSFLMVAVVALVIELGRFHPMLRSTRFFIGAITIVATLAIPAWPSHPDGTSTIAAAQGDSKAGFFDKRTYGDLTNDQVMATYNGVPTTKKIDMLVWPEGASDRDPTRDPFGRYIFDTLSTAYDAPLVSGVITQKDGKDYNSSIVWQHGKVEAQYDKKHLVPFGEYVPNRDIYDKIAPSLVGLLTQDETPGTRSNVVPVGKVLAGISICFDIVDDSLTREMVQGGAKVILAQTNNADFAGTDENTQQLAIARLRAIETSRPLVNISTVGASAVISAQGRTLESLQPYTQSAMVTTVTLGSGLTPAIATGAALEGFLALFGIAAVILARILLRGTPYDAVAKAKKKRRSSSDA